MASSDNSETLDARGPTPVEGSGLEVATGERERVAGHTFRAAVSAKNVFLWPALLVVLALSIFPLIVSLYLSVSRLEFQANGIDVRFLGFDNYASLLFGTEQDHFIGVLKPQRHRLFDDDMFSRFSAGDDVPGMHSARRQNRYRIDIFPGKKVITIVYGWNAKLRCNGVGARADGITDSDQRGSLDMIAAQQLGMTLRNSSTSKQAKPYHLDVPCNAHAASAKNSKATATNPVRSMFYI